MGSGEAPASAMKRDDVKRAWQGPDGTDLDRRHFLERAAMVVGAAHMGLLSATAQGATRELTAIGRASEWLNGPALAPGTLSGKVVLVQFCTYTCINWLRTL